MLIMLLCDTVQAWIIWPRAILSMVPAQCHRVANHISLPREYRVLDPGFYGRVRNLHEMGTGEKVISPWPTPQNWHQLLGLVTIYNTELPTNLCLLSWCTGGLESGRLCCRVRGMKIIVIQGLIV